MKHAFRPGRKLRRVFGHALVCSSLFLSSNAFAQAWIGDENSLSVSLSYAYVPANQIVETNGIAFPNVSTVTQNFILGAEYVTPIERLALDVSLPIIGLQSKDVPGFPPHGRYDDGSSYLVAQDLRLNARYGVFEDEPFAMAVHLGFSIPTHDYEVQGNLAAGRGLKALHAGVAIGRTLDFISERLYGHARYNFSLVEKFESPAPITSTYSQNRSLISAQLGYYIFEDLEAHIAWDFSLSHDGINFVDWNSLSFAEQLAHDVILREKANLIGGGASYALSDTVSLNLLVRIFVGGNNTRNGSMFGGGVSWQVM